MIAWHSKALGPPPRRGFTLAETLLSVTVFAGAAVLVAQLAVWVLSERSKTDARLEAVEATANVLEQARARPWSELTPEWAKSQRLPDDLVARWPDCRLSVRVEPEANRPRVKRVTAELKWTGGAGRASWPPIAMTGLFAPRATEDKP
jgi:hypothetical protein